MGHRSLRYLCEHREVIRRLKARAKDRLRRAVATGGRTDNPEEVLAHVVIAGGTHKEWVSFSAGKWSRRLEAMVQAVEPEGVQWLTVVPVSSGYAVGEVCSDGDQKALDDAIARAMRHVSGRVDVVVRSEADGRKRFVEVVNHLRTDRDDTSNRSTLSEGRLAKALLAPADVEPDLVLVLGPPTQLPTSLVWEMAYSELVFLDIGWNDLSEEHLLMAVDDYRRRNRRFGGIDA
jgi:undecaprenyl diphosphate synthase